MWSKTCNQLLWPINTIDNTDSHKQAMMFIEKYPAFKSLIDLDKAVQSPMAQWQAQGLSIDVVQWSKVLSKTNQVKQQCEADMGVSGMTKSEVVTTLSQRLGIKVVPTFDWVKENIPRYPILKVFKQYLNLISQLSQNQLSDEEMEAGCLLGHWNSYSTYSGRFSCVKRNLLAFPKDYQACWRPKNPTNCLLGFDLSAIQLRITGALSGDERLQASFVSGVDLHTIDGGLVCQWLDVSAPDEPVLHKLGKRLMYALLYGGREKRITKLVKKILGVTVDSGKIYEVHDNFRNRYPQLFKYLDSLEDSQGVTTPYGWIPVSVELAPTQRRNLTIQMIEAILLKKLLLRMSDKDIVMPIHDAIVFEVNPDLVPEFKKEIVRIVDDCVQELVPDLVTNKLVKFTGGITL